MREGAVERAVSTTLGYALTLGISSLLITGLLIAGGDFLQNNRERTIETELEVIGEQVAADLSSADRLVRSGGSNVRVRRELPETATGTSYTVEVQTPSADPVGETHLKLTATDPSVVVRVDFETRTPVDGTASIDGGAVQVVGEDTDGDGDIDQLVIEND